MHEHQPLDEYVLKTCPDVQNDWLKYLCPPRICAAPSNYHIFALIYSDIFWHIRVRLEILQRFKKKIDQKASSDKKLGPKENRSVIFFEIENFRINRNFFIEKCMKNEKIIFFAISKFSFFIQFSMKKNRFFRKFSISKKITDRSSKWPNFLPDEALIDLFF